MKKTLLYLFIIISVAAACKKKDTTTTDPPVVKHFSVSWDKKYSYWLNEETNLHNLVATSDGGAAVFFSWFTDVADGTCLLKTDANGNTEFLHEFPASEFGGGDASLFQTSDNGYLLYGAGSYPVFGKTDASGTILWTKQMNYHQLWQLNCMVEKPSGGFLALARANSQLFIVDLNASGDTNRCFLYKDSTQLAQGIQLQYNSAGQIIVEYLGKFGTDWGSFVEAIDTNFNQIWSVPFTSSGYGIDLQSFYINSDNSIMVAGSIITDGDPTYNTYVASISAAGSVNWTKQIVNDQNSEYLLDIEPAPSGGYYIVADHAIMVTKINSAGDLLWRESLEPANQIGPSGNTLKISGSNMLFFGNTYDLSSMNLNPVLIKFSEQ